MFYSAIRCSLKGIICVFFPPLSLNEKDGWNLLHHEHLKHRDLRVNNSALGPEVGLGLFATKDIDVGSRSGVLCYYWGKVVLATEDELLQHDNPLMQGLRKYMIQFPDRYNPVISPPPPMDGVSQQKLYLVGSTCCIASYANTAAPEECNAVIQDITPIEWNYKEGFTDFDHFMALIKKPILCLKLIR
jgi:hypothetical protein